MFLLIRRLLAMQVLSFALIPLAAALVGSTSTVEASIDALPFLAAGVPLPYPLQGRPPLPDQEPQTIEPTPRKQQRELLKSNFEKMKRDADELVDLAKALQEELGKSNENIFSLRLVEKAEKIEKLAKRIKGAARGY